jgi:asparagine synthase (glutamine-hydrolysing)
VQTAEEQTNALEGQGLKTIEQMMLADLLHYLPDDILTKVDRASMAHGLEVRSPFMDYRIVEFAARLPLKYKLRGLTTKYVLRNAFAADLPPEPLKRRKHGFAVPLGDGFHGHLRKTYEDIVFSGGEANLVNRKESERLLSEHLGGRVDHGHRLWLILFLHAWFQWWNNG